MTKKAGSPQGVRQRHRGPYEVVYARRATNQRSIPGFISVAGTDPSTSAVPMRVSRGDAGMLLVSTHGNYGVKTIDKLIEMIR